MLTKLSEEKQDSLLIELGDENVGTIGGYCEEGFPIYYANEKIAHMLGYDDVEDLIRGIDGKVANTIYEEDMERVVRELNHGVFYEGMTYKVTYRMPKKDGSWMWTVDKGKVLRAEDGRLAILSICNDMTEFLDSYAELERQNELSKSTLENMPGGYHQCSCEDGYPFLYVSNRFLEIFGWTREELKSEFDNKFLNMLHPEDRSVTEGFVDKIREDYGTNLIADEIYRMRGKNGYIWVSDATSLVESNDKVFYQGTLTNITDFVEKQQKQDEALREQQDQLSLALAAAEQSNRAKSTFLSSMSHDIRTPMNAIIGFTALAQTHLDNTALVEEYLTKISTSGTHLLSLINDILDMSRIESGSVKLDEKPVHIPDLLHDLRSMIQGLVNAKQQNLYIDTQDVENEDVIIDKLRLNQVLLNIIGNAIKFTGIGGDIIIRLAEKPCAVKGYTTYEFTIKDNGIGMSPEFVKHVFESFAREYSSTVSGIQGTGLGMAIAKNIVDMMGGTITADSQVGKGTVFTVTLDVRISSQKLSYKPIAELKGARALVVDDDINTCRSVCKMLRSIEMRPDWTTSGKEAVLHAQDAAELKDEYKVYIIDYLMPDMNGIETVRRIRKVIGEEIPIIILSAYDWADFEKEAREAGVTAFVSKPLFLSELKAVLTEPTLQSTVKTGRDVQEKKYDYSGMRVLLVEDNELNREIATAILEETGMQIDAAEDGIEAVNIINEAHEDRYDLIFMDIQMPRMDGYTATKEIRTLANNKKANIPIVAMTANAFDEDRRRAFETGMNGHIVKPIDITTIARTLDGIFGR